MSAGFPGPKAEAWKYTPLGPLAKLDFGLAPRVALDRHDLAPYLLGADAAIRLVFVNGHFAADLSDEVSAERRILISSLSAALERGDSDVADALEDSDSERAFSALNAAFLSDGCLIRLADGAAPDRPVQLLFVSVARDAPAMVNPCNLIVLGDRARLDLIETHVLLGRGSHLHNLVNRVTLGEAAELRHDRLQIGDVSGTMVAKTEYTLSADSRLTQSIATLGGALVRNEIQAVIGGSGIEAGLNGLYLTRASQHIDNSILVDHTAPGSVTEQFYKGVLDGRAQAVFAGKIVVRRAAQKTNAYQSNNNLLLSPDAEIDTKPELEIFADDVKCSHGATAGELDERELFYLRSRGLDPDTARALLTFAFAGEVLERFANLTVRAQVRRELLRWLPGGDVLQELA